MTKLLTLILLLLPPLLLPSCKKAHATPADPQTQSVIDEETGTDLIIRERVISALRQERTLQSDLPNVRVQVRDGNVALTGTASSEANRNRFGIVTKAVGSVVRVDNQIVVKQQ